MIRVRLASLAVLVPLLAGCPGGSLVEGAIGVTADAEGNLAYVLVWCDDPPTSLSISRDPATDPQQAADYETTGLPEGFTVMAVDAASPTPWKLTEGSADLPRGHDYRAFMGIPGSQSFIDDVVFDPDDVRGRVRTGEVFYRPTPDGPTRVTPVAEFEDAVRADC